MVKTKEGRRDNDGGKGMRKKSDHGFLTLSLMMF